MNARVSQLAIGALAIFTGWAGGAAAQTYTVTMTAQTAMGNVVSAAVGDTVFTVSSASGGIVKTSGNGARLTTGNSRTTVRVNCNTATACNTTNVNVRIGVSGSPTGRARSLNGFTVTMNTATLVSGPSGSNPITLQLGPIGRNSNKTFYIGANLPIAGEDSGLTRGAATSSFYVHAIAAPGTPSSGATGSMGATVFRALSVVKQSDISFGRLVKPNSSSNQVLVDAGTGVRTFTGTGNSVAIATPAATRSVYEITGEPNRTVAISVPGSTTITNGTGQTLSVTLSDTAPSSQSLGVGGSYSFGIGGRFSMNASTASGVYSGNFNVTVNYN